MIEQIYRYFVSKTNLISKIDNLIKENNRYEMLIQTKIKKLDPDVVYCCYIENAHNHDLLRLKDRFKELRFACGKNAPEIIFTNQDIKKKIKRRR